MNKLKLSVGMLLLVGVALATNFAACSKSNDNTGAGGSTGSAGAGTAGAATGTAGAGSPTLANGNCVPGAFKHGTPGVCACQSDTPTVCEMMCTNTATDDANCGMCGKACAATATCNAGTCGAEATSVLPAISGCMGMNIAVSGGKVYYTDATHGTVASVPVAGGAATTVVSGEKSPGMIAVTSTTALWISVTMTVMSTGDGGVPITTTTASLRKAALPTGPASDLVVETNTGGGIMGFTLSPDGATVYYSAGTMVKSIPLAAAAGTAATVVGIEQLNGIPTALGISADGMTLAYVTQLNGDVDVITLGTSAASTTGNMCPANTACCGMHDPADATGEALLNTKCTRIARSQGAPFFGGIILKNGTAYWSNDGAIQANAATVGAAQGNVQVSTTGGPSVTALGGTATNIYFGDTADMTLLKGVYTIPTGGAMNPDATQLTRAQTPTSIGFDATKVYWSTASCAISSIAQ